jgi:hypothetical protein
MILVALLSLLGAQAREPGPAAPEPIVVTGQRAPDIVAARQHVVAITSTTEGQIARFQAPVCPNVIGMRPREEAVVVGRIRAVARAAGIETAPERCEPNLVLIVTPSGQRLIEALRQRRPAVFRDVTPAEMRALLRPDAPIRVWRTTEIINEDGIGVSESRTLTVRTASILTEPTRQATLQSVVVIEDGAANGKSLGQLADYTVMRALAGARPPEGGSGAGATILGLFQDATPPPELTRLDRGYLAALYRVAANLRSTTQMARMARMIAQGQGLEGEAGADPGDPPSDAPQP